MKTRHLLLMISLGTLASPLALAAGYGDQSTPSSSQQNQQRSGSMGAAVDDAGTTAKVKAKFAGDNRLDKSDINVDTANGIVTLTGTAPSEEAKQAAEELARQVSGVANVDNQITTSGSTAGTKEKGTTGRVASDSWITTKVKSSLLADNVTKGLNIGVKTMNGNVNLSGTVASRTEFDRAVQIAKNIKGVKKVTTTGLKMGSTESTPSTQSDPSMQSTPSTPSSSRPSSPSTPPTQQ
jgi:hyperosmotically inducible protein